MGTVPTGILEKELRKLYLRWISGLPNAANINDYVDQFQRDSLNLIQSTGADIAALGALVGFPAPVWLELSVDPQYIFDEMKLAAIQAGIASGLNAKDIAKQMLNAGMDTSYSNLERLARTETTNAYWKNQWDSTDGLGLVMVWSAEGGSRTCDWCLNNDGLVVDDSSIRDHPNGRCTLIPTLPKDVKYRGTLRPDGSSYHDPKWDKKPKAAIEDIVVPYEESQFGIEWPTVSIGDRTARLDNSDALERMVDSALSNSEKEAVRKYASGQHFFDIRDAYKNGTPYLLDDGTDLFAALHSALEKSSIGSNTKLYRSMQVSRDWLDEVTPGSNILHDFFISTTTDNAQAQSYGKQKGKRGQKPVLLEILAPKGSKAVPGMSEIQELVLSPDSVMRVVRKTELSKYTYIVVELR